MNPTQVNLNSRSIAELSELLRSDMDDVLNDFTNNRVSINLNQVYSSAGQAYSDSVLLTNRLIRLNECLSALEELTAEIREIVGE